MNEDIQVTIIMYLLFRAKNEDGIPETCLKNNNELFHFPDHLNWFNILRSLFYLSLNFLLGL